MKQFDAAGVTKFYKHPYGGVARDILVSRNGFARFFDCSVELVDSMPVNIKIFDDMFMREGRSLEYYGYKLKQYGDDRIQYRITFIDYKKEAPNEQQDVPRNADLCVRPGVHVRKETSGARHLRLVKGGRAC